MPKTRMTTTDRPRNEGRQLLFSVTADQLRVETFMVGGAGGQHRDRTNAGVRITHDLSGATGQAVDSRSQLQNRKAALKKLTDHPKFKYWVAVETARLDGHETPEQYAAREVATDSHLLVEAKDDQGRWTLAAE